MGSNCNSSGMNRNTLVHFDATLWKDSTSTRGWGKDVTVLGYNTFSLSYTSLIPWIKTQVEFPKKISPPFEHVVFTNKADNSTLHVWIASPFCSIGNDKEAAKLLKMIRPKDFAKKPDPLLGNCKAVVYIPQQQGVPPEPVSIKNHHTSGWMYQGPAQL